MHAGRLTRRRAVTSSKPIRQSAETPTDFTSVSLRYLTARSGARWSWTTDAAHSSCPAPSGPHVLLAYGSLSFRECVMEEKSKTGVGAVAMQLLSDGVEQSVPGGFDRDGH